ncbi:hypothetical protein ACFJI0_16230 [Hydrogenophaga sp. UC242_53]|uniref:hypothetical protein n=1 Tax=Hydrogenophaga sp. UC242_53 TaxID=3350170 RepID=UPI0036D371F0
MKALKHWAAQAALLAGITASAIAPASAQTVYQIPALSDYSGPFAAIMPMVGPGREGVVNWWNAEVGNKLGVKLELKTYDTRYDTAQTASLWPGVLADQAGDRPVARRTRHLGPAAAPAHRQGAHDPGLGGQRLRLAPQPVGAGDAADLRA